MSTGLLALAIAGSAQASMIAQPVTNVATQLKEWNLISFNNLTANGSGEIEGRVFVGGDLNSATQLNFKGTTVSSYGTGAVTVVGNSSGSKIDFTAGDLVVGGNQTAGVLENHSTGTSTAYVGKADSSSTHNGFTPQTGLAASQSNFTSTLTAQKNSLVTNMTNLSTNLKALASTGSATLDQGHFAYTATSGFNVINTTIDQLNNAYNDINIISPDGKTTVINVAGTSGTIDKNFNYNGSSTNIIWNFYEATDLTLGNWQGTVLAPKANFVKDNQGNLQGTVIANNITTNGEIHAYQFQGDLSSVGGSVSAMPEPATWAMLILGFGLVGAVMRRQRGFRLVPAAA